MSFDPSSLGAVHALIAAGAFSVGALAAVLVRLRRVRRLRRELLRGRQEAERLAVQLQEANDALKAKQEELEAYRGEVNRHFSGTSDLLRDLTLRYRAVYDHLAEGARTLCPDGAFALEEGLAGSVLPAGPAAQPPAGGDGFDPDVPDDEPLLDVDEEAALAEDERRA